MPYRTASNPVPDITSFVHHGGAAGCSGTRRRIPRILSHCAPLAHRAPSPGDRLLSVRRRGGHEALPAMDVAWFHHVNGQAGCGAIARGGHPNAGGGDARSELRRVVDRVNHKYSTMNEMRAAK